MNPGRLLTTLSEPVFPRASPRRPLLLAFLLALLAGMWIVSQGYFSGFQASQAVSREWPERFWSCVTVLGDERVLLALGLPFFYRYPRIFWAILLAAILGGLLSRGIKTTWVLPRPAGLLPVEEVLVIGRRVTQSSMPSGHTISAFAFVGVWLAYLPWRQAWYGLPLAALAGFSRVAVGAHWPSDVLLGASLGLLAAALGTYWAERWRWGEAPRVHRVLIMIVALAVATLPFDGQGYPDSLPFRLALTVLVLPLVLWVHAKGKSLS